MIYIAGPLSSPNPTVRRTYMEQAEAAYLALLAARIPAICPHLGGRIPGIWDEGGRGVSYEQWIDNGLAQLRACSALLLLPGWGTSFGATREVAEARRFGITIYHNLETLLMERSSQWPTTSR